MTLFVHCCSVQLYYSAYVVRRTTDDECTCHATLAACYQLAQSVLKVCASEKGGLGEVTGHSNDMPCTWWMSWLAVESMTSVAPNLPWSGLSNQ